MPKFSERSKFELLSFLKARGRASAAEWKKYLFESLDLDSTDDRRRVRAILSDEGLIAIAKEGPREVFIDLTRAGEAWLQENSSGYEIEDENVDADVSIVATSATDIDTDYPTHPYDVRKLRVSPMNLSVFQVLRKIDKGEIFLRPSFQRAFVWDEVRQSRLIESILIRIPLPAFYIDATEDERWEVVDGLQRLTTMHRFWTGHLRLTGLQFLRELESMSFDELPNKYKILIEDNTQLLLYQLQSGTPPQAKFTIFSRLNTGGMTLTPQEIRHALFQGPATKLLADLSTSPEFLRATTDSLSSKRMEDQETLLRGIAFLDGYEYYKSDLDGFLTEAMDNLNHAELSERKAIRREMLSCLDKASAVFGKNAFRKIYSRAQRRSNFNKALFEAWLHALRPYSQSDLIKNADRIVSEFVDLIENKPSFVRSITYGTGSISAVRTRFNYINDLLAGVVM